MPLSKDHTPLRVIDQLADGARSVEGFVPSSLMTSAGPRSSSAVGDHGLLTRSFHLYPFGCFVFVQTHGSARCKWARRVGDGLTRAGYETALRLPDEAGFKRWIRGRRMRMAEMNFLAALGEHGMIERWPNRARTLPPKRARVPSAETWALATAEVFDAPIMWDACAVAYSRYAILRGASQFRVEVSPIGFANCDGPTLATRVVVSNRDGSERGLPQDIAGQLHQVLERRGYDVQSLSSRVMATRVTSSASDAAEEGASIFEQLSSREMR